MHTFQTLCLCKLRLEMTKVICIQCLYRFILFGIFLLFTFYYSWVWKIINSLKNFKVMQNVVFEWFQDFIWIQEGVFEATTCEVNCQKTHSVKTLILSNYSRHQITCYKSILQIPYYCFFFHPLCLIFRCTQYRKHIYVNIFINLKR